MTFYKRKYEASAIYYDQDNVAIYLLSSKLLPFKNYKNLPKYFQDVEIDKVKSYR